MARSALQDSRGGARASRPSASAGGLRIYGASRLREHPALYMLSRRCRLPRVEWFGREYARPDAHGERQQHKRYKPDEWAQAEDGAVEVHARLDRQKAVS